MLCNEFREREYKVSLYLCWPENCCIERLYIVCLILKANKQKPRKKLRTLLTRMRQYVVFPPRSVLLNVLNFLKGNKILPEYYILTLLFYRENLTCCKVDRIIEKIISDCRVFCLF